MILRIAAAAVVAAFGAASAAQAVSFTVTGGDAFALQGNFNPSPVAGGLAPGVSVARNGVLSLTDAGHVTFSYVGTEAGYENSLWADGSFGFDNKSVAKPPFTLALGPGHVPFEFHTKAPASQVANGASSGYYNSIALFQASSSTVYAVFNDGSRSDMDYDDLVVRMDVAPVPLPAAAWLVIAGTGALGAAARRRSPA